MTYEEKEDDQLVTLIVESDRAALEALYGRYSAPIFSLAMNMLRDQGAEEEVTQDVFFNVWRRASSYREQRGKVTSWLFSIAHHRSIDEVRRRRRQQTHVQFGVDLSNKPSTDGVDPVEYATSQSDRGHLDRGLSRLRPEQRDVVVLAYFKGLTHTKIAKQLDQPLGTVKTRMRLALRKMREVLGPEVWESAEHGL